MIPGAYPHYPRILPLTPDEFAEMQVNEWKALAELHRNNRPNMNTKIWIVWCPTKGSPTRSHPSRGSAQAEAERLAQANPDHQYYVFEAVSVSRVTRPVQTSEIN